MTKIVCHFGDYLVEEPVGDEAVFPVFLCKAGTNALDVWFHGNYAYFATKLLRAHVHHFYGLYGNNLPAFEARLRQRIMVLCLTNKLSRPTDTWCAGL